MRPGPAVVLILALCVSTLAGPALALSPQLGIERTVDTGAGSDQYHYDHQSALSWSPDGRWVSGTLWNGTVGVWSENGTAERSLRTSAEHVHSVSWSPDSGRLATGGSDGAVEIWDARDGRRLASWASDGKEVYSVAWSPDGALLASGSANGTIQLWDAATGSARNVSAQHGSIMCVAWSPDGSRLVSGSKTKEVWVWNTSSWTTVARLPPDNDWIRGVGWSADGRLLAYSTNSELLRVVEASDLSRVGAWSIQRGRSAFAWSPAERCIAFGSGPSEGAEGLHFLDPVTGTGRCETRFELGQMAALGWSSDGARLATLSLNGMLRTWGRDQDADGRADATDRFPFDSSQTDDADGDGHGDNRSGASGDAFPGDRTQWSDADNDGFGDNPSGNDPDPAPLDPNVPLRQNRDLLDNRPGREELELTPLASPCCGVLLIIMVIVSLAVFLIWKRKDDHQKLR